MLKSVTDILMVTHTLISIIHVLPQCACYVLVCNAYFCLYFKKEMFYLTTHSTHFIYGYMASDIW